MKATISTSTIPPTRSPSFLMNRALFRFSYRGPRKVSLALIFLLSTASLMPVLGSEVTMTVDAGRIQREIQPGAVGWGAMWKKDLLWPPPPARINTDAEHSAYIERLANALKPLIVSADVRNISWPWGVSFSTWGVNWENSVVPWSQRPVDCARIVLLNKGSGWCEKTVVGVGDLLTLARHWRLEAVTVAVPLAVLDGAKVRYGPDFFSNAISDPVIEKISDHAVRLIEFMKSHPAWAGLSRVYLAAGCEWRHYSLKSPSQAVLTYARLIRRMREKISDSKVIIVASASDSADLEPAKANSWNRYLYQQLKNTQGVALDLHRYRGMIGLRAASDGSTAAVVENVDRLVRTGLSQRNWLTVHPNQWRERGKAMPSVLLENAIHGLIGDHKTHSPDPAPWPVVMAHADLVREALASDALTFLAWTWFPEDLPREWPHGALRSDGTLAPHAKAQAFLSQFHVGALLYSAMSDESAVRANATRSRDGRIRIYGGNFSRYQQTLRLHGIKPGPASLEILSNNRVHKGVWDGRSALTLPPMTLWRIAF